MTEYRIRATGAIMNRDELKSMFADVFLPQVLTLVDFEHLAIDPVLPAPAPEHGKSQLALRDGAILNGLGQWVQRWRIADLPAEDLTARLAEMRQALLIKIDKDVDTIYDAAIGSRGMEYALASEQAYAFKAINYQGEVPSSVASWAAAKNWNAKQAADDIILAAERWGRARDALREKRLAHKEEARAATSIDALSLVEPSWNTFVVSIRIRLGI